MPQRMQGQSRAGRRGVRTCSRAMHNAALNSAGGNNKEKLRGRQRRGMKASLPCSHPRWWRSISSPTVVVLHSSCDSVQLIHY